MDSYSPKNRKIIYLEGMFSNILNLGVQSFSLTALAIYFQCSTFWLSVMSSLPIGAQMLQVFFNLFCKASKTRRNALMISSIVGRVLFLLVPIAVLLKVNKPFVLVFTVVVYSVFNSFNLGVWTAIIRDTVPEKQRNRFFAMRYVFIGIVTVIFSYVCGKMLNIENKDVGIFLLSSFIAISGVISIFLFSIQTIPKETTLNKVSNLLAPFKDAKFKKFLAFLAIWNFSIEFTRPYYPYYAITNLSVSYEYLGFVASVGAIFSVICYPIMGKLAEKYGNKKLIANGIVVTTYMIMLYCFLGTQNYRSILLLDAIGSAISWSAIYLCLFNLFLEVASDPIESYIASYYTVVGSFGMIGGILGGIVANFLKDEVVLVVGDSYHGLQIMFVLAIFLRLYSVLLLSRVESFEKPTYYEGLKAFTLNVLGFRK